MSNKLIYPTVDFCKEIENYRNEMIQNNDSFDGCSDLRKFENMEKWVQYTYDLQDKNKIPPHYVTAEQYLLVNEKKRILGMIQLRHELNDYLLEIGGHIGYSVRPSERRKGYATRILSYALKECKKLGLDKVILGCYKKNIGSAKTIIKNGGKLIREEDYIKQVNDNYTINLVNQFYEIYI